MSTYYETLELKETASAIEIKKAYRSLAKKWHPDMNPDVDTTDAFVAIEVAYSCLSNRNTKAAYDRLLQMERERVVSPAMNRKYAQTIRKRTRKTYKNAHYHSNLSYDQYRRDELFRGEKNAWIIKGVTGAIIALLFFVFVAYVSDNSPPKPGSNRESIVESEGILGGLGMLIILLPVPFLILISYLYEPLIKFLVVGRPKRKKKHSNY